MVDVKAADFAFDLCINVLHIHWGTQVFQFTDDTNFWRRQKCQWLICGLFQKRENETPIFKSWKTFQLFKVRWKEKHFSNSPDLYRAAWQRATKLNSDVHLGRLICVFSLYTRRCTRADPFHFLSLVQLLRSLVVATLVVSSQAHYGLSLTVPLPLTDKHWRGAQPWCHRVICRKESNV